MPEGCSGPSSARETRSVDCEITPQKLIFRYFLVLTFTALVVGSVLLNVAALRLLPTRGDTMYPETANVLPGIALLRGGHVYPDFNGYPFFPSVYGPLFYFCIAAFARIFHSDLFVVLVCGRVLSYFCFIASGLFAFLIARRLGCSRRYAIAAWLGIAFCADFYRWNVTFRPDLPALMLGLAAIYLVLRAGSDRRGLLVGAGLCVGAAFLLKQSVFMAALAVMVWLVSSKRFRDAGIFVASAGALVIPVFGFLQLREPALQRVMALRYAPHDVASAVAIVQHAVFRADGALLMTLALVAIFSSARHRLLLIYFVCGWTLPLWALMQTGANANYLLEGWSACALLLPCALLAVEKSWPRLQVVWRGALVLGLVAVLAGQTGLWKYFTARRMPPKFGEVALLRDLKVFGDVPYLTGNGRDPELPEPFLAHMFAVTGHWSPAPVAARLDARVYDVIFLGEDRGFVRGWRGVTNIDPILLNHINVDYDVICTTGEFVVLTPNSRVVPFTASMATEVLGQSCVAPRSSTLSSVVKFEVFQQK